MIPKRPGLSKQLKELEYSERPQEAPPEEK
jgi:hypothetical protein